MSSAGPEARGDELPDSAWAMGWAFFAAAVVGLFREGVSDASAGWVLISVMLSAVLVCWFAAGVLAGAPIRMTLTAVLVGLVLLLEAAAVVAAPEQTGRWINLLLVAAPAFFLARFSASSYYVERRGFRGEVGVVPPAGSGLLLLALATGALGGLADQASGAGVHVHVGL